MPEKHLIKPDQFKQISSDVGVAIYKAQMKFPKWSDDLVHGASIMMEEAGEAVKAANQTQWEGKPISEFRKELLHTAAMCYRNIAHIDNLNEPDDA